MARQPNFNDLRVTGQAGTHLCAFAHSGEFKGQRFVKPQGGLWIPAGAASSKELGMAGLFDKLFKSTWGAA